MRRQRLLLLAGLLSLLLSAGCAMKQETAMSGGTPPAAGDSGSVLERGLHRYRHLIEVRLEGATDEALAEIFGTVVVGAPSVVSATRYASRIIPDDPLGCWVVWRVTVAEEGSVATLQTEMMGMIRDIGEAGGRVDGSEVPSRFGRAEIDLLKGVHPVAATSRRLVFAVDRELARDREMAEW